MATPSENSRAEKTRGRARGGRPRAASAINTDALLDIVSRLGLVDLVTSKVRARLEEVDIDEVLDDIGAYVKRNPEVLVVALATVTVSAGLIVYLDSRRDDWNEEEELKPTPIRARARR